MLKTMKMIYIIGLDIEQNNIRKRPCSSLCKIAYYYYDLLFLACKCPYICNGINDILIA